MAAGDASLPTGVVAPRPSVAPFPSVALRTGSTGVDEQEFPFDNSLSDTSANWLSERLGYDFTLLKDLRGHRLGRHADLPVFLIQCHGDTRVDIGLDRRQGTSSSEGTVGWKKSANNFTKVARSSEGHVEWIIQPTPIGKVAVCTGAEDKLAEIVGRNLIQARNTILSAHPEGLFAIADSDTGQRARGSSSFIPPTGVYFDKDHTVYDEDDTYDWPMLILPIFQPTSIPEVERVLDFQFFKKDLDEPNAEYAGDSTNPREQVRAIQEQMRDRIKNRKIFECEGFWKRGPDNPFWPTDNEGKKIPVQGEIPTKVFINKLRKRYGEITRIWEEALPEVVGISRGTNEALLGEGKDIKLSKIMDTLGSGIYVSLTCSPLTNLRFKGDRPAGVPESIAREAGQREVNRLNEFDLARWRRIFSEDRSERGTFAPGVRLKIGPDYHDSDPRYRRLSRRHRAHEEGSLSEATLAARKQLAATRKTRRQTIVSQRREAPRKGGARTRRRRRPRKMTKKKALRKRHHRRTRRHRSKRRRRRRTRRRRAGGLTTRRCREKAKSIINRLLPSGLRLKTEQGKMVKLIAKDFECSTEEARRLLKDPAFVKDFALAGGRR